jgi:hypothetical protein
MQNLAWCKLVTGFCRGFFPSDTSRSESRSGGAAHAGRAGSRIKGREPTIPQQEMHPMAKIAKTGDRKKMMDTNKSTDCPRCSKPTRIVKRVKDRERGIPGGVYISCSACEFFEKL